MERDVSRGDEGAWEERTERWVNTKMGEAYTTEGERGDHGTGTFGRVRGGYCRRETGVDSGVQMRDV